jgi:uncharacterized protein involved in type VI secretion and phage assembly
MHRMVHTIRQIARHESEQRGISALGLVKSVHGANGLSEYSCTVELRETSIVLPKVPIATGLIGSVALPRENDLVLVVFVGGDLHAPVIVGRLYNEEVAPPAHGPGEVVVSLPGDETAEDARLELRVITPGDGTRTATLLLDGDVQVKVEVKDDGVRIQAQEAVLELSQSGSSDGKAELSVGDTRVTLEQGGDMSLEAAGKLTLKASEVEISGDATVKIAGQTIDLN